MKISNATINKLTTKEMNDLGCLDIGIMLYNGELKTRAKGYKRESIDGTGNYAFNNEISNYRHEFILLADGKYAYRLYNEIEGKYEVDVMPLEGLKFIK